MVSECQAPVGVWLFEPGRGLQAPIESAR